MEPSVSIRMEAEDQRRVHRWNAFDVLMERWHVQTSHGSKWTHPVSKGTHRYIPGNQWLKKNIDKFDNLKLHIQGKNSLFVCEWMFGLFCFDQIYDKNYIVHGGHCKHEWNMNMLKHTNQSRMWHMALHLIGGWPIPLKNMSSSVGMMTFPIYGKS